MKNSAAIRRLLLPGISLYAIFFIIPLSILAVYSFWTQIDFKMHPGFTLEHYQAVFTTSLYRDVFLRTIIVATLTAIIVVPIAYILSYIMQFVFPSKARLLLNIILISMFSGYLVRIYAWRTILGKEGLLNTALIHLGIITKPITFLIFSNWSIAITLVGLLIPLALLPIWSSMSNVSKDHLEVAGDLGSRGFQMHRTILIPMVLPGIATAFAISFILAAGDFVVPTMLGGTNGVMAGNLIADQFKGLAPNWPLGASLAICVLAILIAIQMGFMKLVREVTRL
jgi:spermidine/putrescine transport system permease protein